MPDQSPPLPRGITAIVAGHTCKVRVTCGATLHDVDSAELHPRTAHRGPQKLVCTLPVGHEPELHRDQICCYDFHRFLAPTPEPKVTIVCEKCMTEWPCDVVRVASIARASIAGPAPADRTVWAVLDDGTVGKLTR